MYCAKVTHWKKNQPNGDIATDQPTKYEQKSIYVVVDYIEGDIEVPTNYGNHESAKIVEKYWFGNNTQGNDSQKSKVNNLELDKNINEYLSNGNNDNSSDECNFKKKDVDVSE